MDDLLTWLREQVDDDEAYARNAFGDHNDAGPEWREQWSGALNIGDHEDLVLTNDSQVSRFMARFDPARVLAEVDAKRRILDEHNDPMSDGRTLRPGGARLVCGTCLEFGRRDERQLWPCNTLRLLALPYADRPGYRDEWKP